MDSRELKRLIEGASDELKALIRKQEEELAKQEEELVKQDEELAKQDEELAKQIDEAEKRIKELTEELAKMDEGLKEVQAAASRPKSDSEDAPKSIGSQFIASDVGREIKSQDRATGRAVTLERRANIVGTSVSAGALAAPTRDPEVYRSLGGYRPVRVADLIPSIPVNSGSVEIMRQNVFTNAAGPQGNVAGVGMGEMFAKPESTIAWELVTVPVRTIAHWVPASRQVLQDAPMLRGLIDRELDYGLQLESDDQLLFGDGTGQNMLGMMIDAGVTDIGELASGTPLADVPAAMIDHIRTAITACQINEYYNITGVILNPTDWETLETAKATDGHYIRVPYAPSAGAVDQIWRIPVVISNGMTAGNFLLGDFTMGPQRYTRDGVSVRVSESHADFFVRNGVAILGEYREALAISRPKALAKGQFTVAP